MQGLSGVAVQLLHQVMIDPEGMTRGDEEAEKPRRGRDRQPGGKAADGGKTANRVQVLAGVRIARPSAMHRAPELRPDLRPRPPASDAAELVKRRHVGGSDGHRDRLGPVPPVAPDTARKAAPRGWNGRALPLNLLDGPGGMLGDITEPAARLFEARGVLSDGTRIPRGHASEPRIKHASDPVGRGGRGGENQDVDVRAEPGLNLELHDPMKGERFNSAHIVRQETIKPILPFDRGRRTIAKGQAETDATSGQADGIARHQPFRVVATRRGRPAFDLGFNDHVVLTVV